MSKNSSAGSNGHLRYLAAYRRVLLTNVSRSTVERIPARR